MSSGLLILGAARSPRREEVVQGDVPSRIPLLTSGATGRAHAFTILEIMIAVTILGLLMSAVYATWQASLSGWKRGTSVAEEFQRQRVVMEALDDLTQSALFFTAKPELYEVRDREEYGLGDSVSFVTGSDLLLPPSERGIAGMRRVTIAMLRDQRLGTTYLGISNAPAIEDAGFESDPVWHVLSQDVAGFRVDYRHPRDGGWYERWEQPGLVPMALKFTVAFASPDPTAPPLIVTRAVELPAAAFAMEARGGSGSQQSTTNRVTRQTVDLSSLGSTFPSEGERQ